MKNYVVFCGILVLLWTSRLPCQQTTFGVAGGLQNTMHAADFSQLGNYASCCPKFSDGTGIGYWFSGGVEFPVFDVMRIVPRFNIAVHNGTLRYDEWTVVADLRTPPSVRDALFRHELNTSVSTVGLEVVGAVQLLPSFDVVAGIRTAWIWTSQFHQTEHLVHPADYGSYVGGGRVWVDHRGTIPNALPLQFGLLTGLRYALPLSQARTVVLLPEVTYHHSLTQVTSTERWKTHDLRIGVGVSVALRNAEAKSDTVPEPPTTNVHNIPPPADPPVAFIQVSGKRGGHEVPFDTIRVEETEIVDWLPVLGHVYFDKGSDSIPSRFIETGRTAFVKPEALTLEEATSAVLGIVASRMIGQPGCTIELIGCTSDVPGDEGIVLAQRRAESVRRELLRYGIHPGRITIRSQRLPSMPTRASDRKDDELAHEENRRVELIPSDPEILDPLTLRQTHRTVIPDSLIIRFSIQSRLPLRSQTVRIPTTPAHNFYGSPYTIPSPTQTDSAIMVVVDSLGQSDSVLKVLPVSYSSVQKKRTEHQAGIDVERYSLILFKFDDATVTKEHRRVLNHIRTKINEGATVTILGMTDVMGSQDYNTTLSRKRASEVAKVLGIEPQFIQALGSKQPRFRDSVPEGRAYNRTVVIELRP